MRYCGPTPPRRSIRDASGLSGRPSPESISSTTGLDAYRYDLNGNLADPLGMTVTIGDFKYTLGAEYLGRDKFIADITEALNLIAEWGGEKVIDELVNSKSNFNFVKLPKGMSSYLEKHCNDDNYTVAISPQNDNNVIGSVAHESFHGIQFLNGQGGPCDFNEVGAYTFASVISYNSTCLVHKKLFFYPINETCNDFGKTYKSSMEYLQIIGFDPYHFMRAVFSFKKGFTGNVNDLYSNNPLFPPTKNHKILIKKYSPWIPE